MTINLTDLYWDCECETDNYFNHVSDTKCFHCGAEQDEMPSSREEEIIAFACANLVRQHMRLNPEHEKVAETPIYVKDLANMLRDRGCKV